MSAAAVAPAPHAPVLLDEVVAGLAVQPGTTQIDGTFGASGYTRALLEAGAGEYTEDASINGSMLSGEKAAGAVLA